MSKKLAVVASGWHFPLSFYEKIAQQKIPKGWTLDMFVVSHRSPTHAKKEKKGKVFTGERAYLDKQLYNKISTIKDIEKLGWNYTEEPNTVGDWGNSNQWLAKHDYTDYDVILFTHDDNLILSDTWFKDVIEDASFMEWGILSNSLGMPKGSLRGSCEFFKKEVLEKMGGSFDLSTTTLRREGQTTSSEDLTELYDWNNLGEPMQRFIEKNKIAVGFLSPSYRVSAFCIEGERGYIGNTHGQNTKIEDEGLHVLKTLKLI